MTIPDIVSCICARDPTVSKTKVSNVVKETFEIIADSLEKGESVTINNFGKFCLVWTAEKKAQDFYGGTVSIPPHYIPKFRASKALKDKISGE